MPLPYKPAADSRHRRACFALYRALVRQGLQIPLPHDILEGNKKIPKNLAPRSSYFVGRKDGNPIPALITHAFRRNRKLDSTRLICLALKNGYRFLDLFAQAKAQAPLPSPTPMGNAGHDSAITKAIAANLPSQPVIDPTRPIYSSVIQFLRENEARVTKYLLDREASEKPNPFRPHPDYVPLLTLLPPTKDNPGPVFVPTSRPRPLSELSGGVRKLPTLDECTGYPFLRLSKPQSPVLSVMVWSNARSRQKRLTRYLEMKDKDLEMGKQEDDWDFLVEGMQDAVERAGRHHGKGRKVDWEQFISTVGEKRKDSSVGATAGEKRKSRRQSVFKTDPSTWNVVPRSKRVAVDWASRQEIGYGDSWKISIEELGARLTRQNELWVARGRALWGIVEAERAFADKEAKERGRRTFKRPVGSLYRDRVKDWKKAWTRRQLKVREDKIKMLEEKGDLEGAEKLRNSKFKLRHPRRMGFKKREMVEVVHV